MGMAFQRLKLWALAGFKPKGVISIVADPKVFSSEFGSTIFFVVFGYGSQDQYFDTKFSK
jgi:hypothetical protein